MKILFAIIMIICLFHHAIGQSANKTMKHLPDTGETTGFTSTFGEDNDYSIYTPFLVDNGDGTITDTITGLMWQKTDGGEMTIENARLYCNTLSLGGDSNWRLPTIHEGLSILNLNHLNPALDTNFFTYTTAGYWWSADIQIGDTTKIWVTNAGGGVGNHPKSETISAGGVKRFHVRAVRDVTAPPIVTQHFTDNGNGTVTDEVTNLIWQKASLQDTITWEQALTFADTLTIAGYTDWRLPNIKEIESINDEQYYNPSINPIFEVGTGGKHFWSSTTQINQVTNAWYLDGLYGLTTYIAKTRNLYTLCVRGGQSLPTYAKTLIKNNLNTCIYPNPASSGITLSYAASEAITVRIAVQNEAGVVVEDDVTDFKNGGGHHIVDTGNWPAGVYFYSVQVTHKDRSVQYENGKFIVTK